MKKTINNEKKPFLLKIFPEDINLFLLWLISLLLIYINFGKDFTLKVIMASLAAGFGASALFFLIMYFFNLYFNRQLRKSIKEAKEAIKKHDKAEKAYQKALRRKKKSKPV